MQLCLLPSIYAILDLRSLLEDSFPVLIFVPDFLKYRLPQFASIMSFNLENFIVNFVAYTFYFPVSPSSKHVFFSTYIVCEVIESIHLCLIS